jgi:hypothetical protein
MRKIIFVIAGVIVLFFMGKCFYMVACISCTTLPIKIYGYNGSMDDLEADLKSFDKKHSFVDVSISRRGPGKYDARDVTVNVRLKYKSVKYTLGIRDFNNDTELTVDELFDETNKRGGNKEDAPEVKELFKEFKNSFLPQFEREQNTTLKPKLLNF